MSDFSIDDENDELSLSSNEFNDSVESDFLSDARSVIASEIEQVDDASNIDIAPNMNSFQIEDLLAF